MMACKIMCLFASTPNATDKAYKDGEAELWKRQRDAEFTASTDAMLAGVYEDVRMEEPEDESQLDSMLTDAGIAALQECLAAWGKDEPQCCAAARALHQLAARA